MQLRARVSRTTHAPSRRCAVKVCNAVGPHQPAPRKAFLIDRLGGPAAVKLAVDKFYNKVLADDRVNFYFKNTDMVQQRAHQAAFMTFAFGGPNEYKGKDMAAVHRHLIPHLEEGHFEAIVDHFVATLHELEVPQEDIDAAVEVVVSTKADVLAD